MVLPTLFQILANDTNMENSEFSSLIISLASSGEILNGCEGSSFHISSNELCRKGVKRLGTLTRNSSSFGRWWKCVQHVKRPSCGPYYYTLLIENKVYSVFLSSSKKHNFIKPPRFTCFSFALFFFHKPNFVIRKWLQPVRGAKWLRSKSIGKSSINIGSSK